MKFDQSTPLYEQAQGYREAKRYTPQATGAHVIAELCGVGLLLFLMLGTAASIAYSFPWKWALLFATVGAFLLFVVVLWYSFQENLLWIVEEVIGYDANHDGYVGAPTQVHFSLQSGPSSLRMGQVEIEPPLLIEWCQAAIQGRSLGFAAWEPRFALPDGKQGRERYTAFRDWLVAEGFAEEAGGNVGLRVRWGNPLAVDFVRGFALMSPGEGTPLLEGGKE